MNSPEKIKDDNLTGEIKEIAEVIGVENAKKLIYYFGGACIYIPVIKSVDLNKRNMMIAKGFQSGLTTKQLASKYSLCDVSIRNILKTGTNKK